jgi:hypothetical protein
MVNVGQILISPVKLLLRTWTWMPKMCFRKSRDPRILESALVSLIEITTQAQQ